MGGIEQKTSRRGYWWLKWLLLVAMLMAYSISNRMPSDWWQENSPLEWAQVGILLAGAIICVSRARTAAVMEERYSASFWGWMSVPILLMAGRELSWGRVLFPIGRDDNGPIFVPMRELWFGDLIHAVVVLTVLVCIYAVIRFRFYRVPLDLCERGLFPWLEAVLTIAGFACALLAAKLMRMPMLEEVLETLAYVGLVIWALQTPLIVQRISPMTSEEHRRSRASSRPYD